jgi:hypothetical protein
MSQLKLLIKYRVSTVIELGFIWFSHVYNCISMRCYKLHGHIIPKASYTWYNRANFKFKYTWYLTNLLSLIIADHDAPRTQRSH